MTYNVNIYLTTVYDVEASSEAEAIDLVTENLEIDFEVEPNE